MCVFILTSIACYSDSMSKLIVARALSAYVARRMVFVATIVAVGVFAAVIAACMLLSYFFSAWWWLLALPFALLLALFFIIRLIVAFIIGRIHSEKLSDVQRQALEKFTDKIQRLLEARATPLPIFALITMKDLVLYRDIKTVRELINDTSGLKKDYEALERMF